MLPLRDDIPRRSLPVVTWSLIALNVAVFVIETQLSEGGLARALEEFGIVPARAGLFTDERRPASLSAHAVWPFFTSLFLHGGLLHVFGNMWTLWIFGDNVEDRMGPLRFTLFYLLCGLAAGLAHTWSNPASTVPAIGASGAIAGVLGAYFVLYPRARILILVPIFFYPLFFQVSAFFYLGWWFLMQLASGSIALRGGATAGESVAWWAHVGGFLFGMASFALFLRRRRRDAPFYR